MVFVPFCFPWHFGRYRGVVQGMAGATGNSSHDEILFSVEFVVRRTLQGEKGCFWTGWALLSRYFGGVHMGK